jgi:release factor glutamine methyltransferase
MYPDQIGTTLRRIRASLEPVAGGTALFEAECILEHVLGMARSSLYLEQYRHLTPLQLDATAGHVEKRLTGMPLAYVLGVAYFHTRKFAVSPAVLIPRPETEVLVERVLEEEPEGPCLFLDMGTGSGAIAETLTASRPQWRAVAVDLSVGALAVARRNCSPNVRLACMDKVEGIGRAGVFDFIVSNPPYISAAEMDELDHSVVGFEPREALFGGIDGTDFYRYLARHARPLLKGHGRLYCEIGAGQGDVVRTLFRREGWGPMSIAPDLAGRARVVRTTT